MNFNNLSKEERERQIKMLYPGLALEGILESIGKTKIERAKNMITNIYGDDDEDGGIHVENHEPVKVK